MKTQRLLVVLTVINLGLLVFLLAQTRVHIGLQGLRVWTNVEGSVLRGRALEIVDDQGRTRAAINLHPADQTRSYPETAILRLIDQNGRPSVKLSTSERGGALALVSDAENTYVQIVWERDDSHERWTAPGDPVGGASARHGPLRTAAYQQPRLTRCRCQKSQIGAVARPPPLEGQRGFLRPCVYVAVSAPACLVRTA
jgi:hypothetical protein